jgi:hypothetical protein
MSRILFCLFDDIAHFSYKNSVENCLGSLKYFHADAHVLFVGGERSFRRHEDLLCTYEQVNSVRGQSVDKPNKFIQLDDALSYAKTHQYDYVYLLPSTFQFIDDPSEFLHRAVELLETRDDVAIVCGDCVSDKILSTYPRRHEWNFDESAACFKSIDFGFHESGLIRVENLIRYGFRFGNGRWRLINSWWLSKGLFAYVFHAPLAAKIPWINQRGFVPTINPGRGEFILERRLTTHVGNDRPIDWQAGCQLRQLSAERDLDFWDSPEQYTGHLLESNTSIRTIRKIVHMLLPRHLRLFSHMVCEK